MLFLLHRGNHPELNYAGGQQPIVHLQADLNVVLQWAAQYSQRWAFTAANAGATYAQFYAQSGQLDAIDWSAVNATDFRDRTSRSASRRNSWFIARFRGRSWSALVQAASRHRPRRSRPWRTRRIGLR
jgi:hypothetical protein